MTMHNTIRALTALGLLAILPLAQAGGTYAQGWGIPAATHLYGGISAGIANLNEFEDSTAPAGKLFGGVRINQMLGVELGYIQLGETESETVAGRLAATVKNDTSALYAAGVGYLPIAPRLELLGKAGVVRWSQDNSKSIPLTDERSSSSDSGLSPLLGLGAQYRLGQNLRVRGEWERAFKTGTEDSEYETDLDLLSIGVSFSTL